MGRRKSELQIAAEKAGLKYTTVYMRVRNGMPIEEALSRPANQSMVTAEARDFIYANVAGISTEKLTSLVNDRFGTAYSVGQMLSYKKNHGLNSGLTGRYEKGSVPANKGKRLEDFMSPETIEAFRKNTYRTGHLPHNHQPVGTEVVRGDGYIWRKVAEPNRWREKHRIVYESYHGEIPKGKCVTFLDLDHRNFSRENLVLVSKAENQYLNKMSLRFTDRELTKTGIAIARLNVAMNKRTKEK